MFRHGICELEELPVTEEMAREKQTPTSRSCQFMARCFLIPRMAIALHHFPAEMACERPDDGVGRPYSTCWNSPRSSDAISKSRV
jgi:hypothetical protein